MDFRLFEFPAFTLLLLGQKNVRHFGANKDETQPTKRDETKPQKWGHLAFFWCSPWRNTLWALTSVWIPGSFVVRRSVVMLVISTAPRFGVGWHAATGPGEKCCWCLVQQRERVVKLWLIQMKWEWWWATSTWILSHDSTIRKKICLRERIKRRLQLIGPFLNHSTRTEPHFKDCLSLFFPWSFCWNIFASYSSWLLHLPVVLRDLRSGPGKIFVSRQKTGWHPGWLGFPKNSGSSV